MILKKHAHFYGDRKNAVFLYGKCHEMAKNGLLPDLRTTSRNWVCTLMKHGNFYGYWAIAGTFSVTKVKKVLKTMYFLSKLSVLAVNVFLFFFPSMI